MATADQLRQALADHGRSHDGLVLDLAAVGFIDSSGLSVLLAAHHDAQLAGRRLALRPALSPAVRRLFEVAGVHDMFAYSGERVDR
jgi:stage II sporulation protein AA (anti-sigma F factor antagonist)